MLDDGVLTAAWVFNLGRGCEIGGGVAVCSLIDGKAVALGVVAAFGDGVWSGVVLVSELDDEMVLGRLLSFDSDNIDDEDPFRLKKAGVGRLKTIEFIRRTPS